VQPLRVGIEAAENQQASASVPELLLATKGGTNMIYRLSIF